MVVEQFKALGDPVRWAIVRELRAGTRCACELSEVAAVSPPLLSHHLKVLREAGLIAGAKRGRWVDYTLDTDALAQLLAAAEPEAMTVARGLAKHGTVHNTLAAGCENSGQVISTHRACETTRTHRRRSDANEPISS